LSEREVEAFDPAEFLARVIMHIPEPRRHMVRYYGWYSNVSRGKRRLREEACGLAGVGGRAIQGSREREADIDARTLRRSWGAFSAERTVI